MKNEETCDVYKVYVADLEFGPSSINPFSIIGHSINIGECLDSHLDFSRVVNDILLVIRGVSNGW